MIDENLILLTEVGSDLHGVSVNAQDDIDQMGVYIEPPEKVFGLHLADDQHRVKRWHRDGTPIGDGERSGPGDTDETLYGLRKFVRLAAAGNPTVLMPLFAPPEKVKFITPMGEALREAVPEFVTRQAGRKFLGYCQGQYAQMIDVKGKHTNRPELIAQYGFDTKFAYHALRLCIQGHELMTTGWITLPMSEGNQAFIKNVRVGTFTKQSVTSILDEMIQQLEQDVNNFVGPDKMDVPQLDRMLMQMYMTHWENRNII